MKNIVYFFDLLEDSIRSRLSRFPKIYAILGGAGIVLFWRGIWDTADILSTMHPVLAWIFYPPIQIALSVVGLSLIGLMVSAFIGHRLLLSGLRNEKKIEEQTERLVHEEAVTLSHLRDEIRALRKEVDALKK